MLLDVNFWVYRRNFRCTAIGETQAICNAVTPLRFLILIFLFDSTVVTKENLHLKKKFKTENSEYVELE